MGARSFASPRTTINLVFDWLITIPESLQKSIKIFSFLIARSLVARRRCHPSIVDRAASLQIRHLRTAA